MKTARDGLLRSARNDCNLSLRGRLAGYFRQADRSNLGFVRKMVEPASDRLLRSARNDNILTVAMTICNVIAREAGGVLPPGRPKQSGLCEEYG